MATKEEFKASVQRLKDLQASRKESGAQARAEIQALLDKGDTRGAYRRFEELPILDQLAISLTPGVGDALAVFETGEFGTRAGERFAQDDILGGLGNVALSGLAGLSTIPVIGALPTVAKTLTRVAKTAEDMPGGSLGGALVEKAPNEYRGTKLSEGVNIGLKSPNLESLRKMNPTKERELKALVTRLVKENPGKAGELRALNVIEDIKPGKFSGDRIVLTTEVQKFFPNPNKVTAGGLDLYMTSKMPDALQMRAAPGIINKSAGTSTSASKERLYGVRDLELKKDNAHTTQFFDKNNPDNTIAFDSVELEQGVTPGDPSVLRVNRLQSDYGEELSKTSRSRKDLGFQSSNPFVMPEVKIPEEVMKMAEDLKAAVARKNAKADEYNKLNNLDFLFENVNESVLPKARVNLQDFNENFVSLNKTTDESSAVTQDFGQAIRDIGDIKKKMQASLKQNNPDLFNAGYFKNIELKEFLDYGSLPEAQKKIYDRNLHYGIDTKYDTGFSSIPLEQEYYGGIPQKEFDVFLKTDTDTIDEQIGKLNLGDSDLVYKKDPYQEGMTSRTHVYPIRAMVNEAAQATDAKLLEIPVGRLRKSGEIAGSGDSAATIFKYYEDMYDELNKISSELELPTGSVFKIEDFTETLRVKDPAGNLNIDKDFDLDTIKIDLDAVREALADGKQISAFKRGGPANIDSLLNNL